MMIKICRRSSHKLTGGIKRYFEGSTRTSTLQSQWCAQETCVLSVEKQDEAPGCRCVDEVAQGEDTKWGGSGHS